MCGTLIRFLLQVARMNEPVRTPEAWPADLRPGSIRWVEPPVNSDGAWWTAGLMLGVILLLLWALLDAREENLDLTVRIQTLETQALQHRVQEDAWTCSRPSRKKDGLVKWCLRSESM